MRTTSTVNRTSGPQRSDAPVRVPLLLVLGGLAIAYLPARDLLRWAGIEVGLPGPTAVIPSMWALTALLLLWVRFAERLPLRSLRLVRPTEADLSWAGWLGGAAVLWHWVMSQWVVPTTGTEGGATDSGAGQLVALGPLLALALVVTVSVTEEILWRGYVVERLGAWIGLAPAAAIGLVVFTIPHVLFFGPWWLLTTLPSGALLYVLLMWRRNLWACMLAHAVTDIPIVVVTLVA